ncbi:MAG TPA: beta-ketoacyl synthase N-terminal-like domain-containing protein [Verrucomicrobiae bacterium]|nr:beta-ketoacyl synthase N-terminal-like domain-containing protein [Verrucomicrobiae bacterium]
MNKISEIAKCVVDETQLPSARLGPRFGRLDLQSRLALLAVASLQADFEKFSGDRIGICLAASAGSLTTDLNFWKSRKETGGPSPTLFAYTLPSAAIGEIAIHFKLTGPNLCFVGDGKNLFAEATDMISCGEIDACVCVFCEIVSPGLAEMISVPAVAKASAAFLARESNHFSTVPGNSP